MARFRRRWRVVSLFVLMFWLLGSTLQSQNVYAEKKKVTGTGTLVTILSQTKMYPGDVPKHVVTVTTRLDTDKSPNPDFDNSQVTLMGVSDYTAGTGVHRGYRSVVMPSGDKWYAGYEGMTKTVPKEGEFPQTTFEGKWWFTGGTGMFKGVTGGGTYKGQVTKTGVTYDWEGEYDLKK